MEISKVIQDMKRPRILVRAARIGAQNYAREGDVKSLLARLRLPKGHRSLDMLVSIEQALEESRKTGAPDYNATRHVDLLSALLAVARLRRVPV